MKIRMIAIAVTVVMLLSLSACGHEHQWTEASCLAPKTCQSCGETEGEALGHSWTDATCDTPKTCTRCAVTEGAALGHSWADATYLAPKTCTVCAATEGEALVSYFAESGLEAKLLDKDGEYALAVPCYEDESKTTVAKVTAQDYKTIASDETHEAKDGYEWKELTLKLLFHDENAWNYGFQGFMYLWCDNKYEDCFADGEDPNMESLFAEGIPQPITWNGTQYADGWLRIAETGSGWAKDAGSEIGYYEVTVTVSVRIPTGYDGIVFGLEQPGWDWTDGAYLHEVITENALLFCFD